MKIKPIEEKQFICFVYEVEKRWKMKLPLVDHDDDVNKE
jgi:hypothetical protein